jgi:hypothetical protein
MLRLALASAVCLSLCAGRAQAQPGATAEQLLDDGVALAEKKDYAGARTKLQAAFKLKQTFDIAANLGFVEAELGAWKDAAGHLEYARRMYPPTNDPSGLGEIEKYLAKAKLHVGGLQVEGPADATVRVDGAQVGKTPLDAAIFVEPGKREILLTKPGFEDAREVVDATAGETKAIRIDMKPATGATTSPGSETRPVWPAVLMGGIGAAGLALGIGGVVAGVGATGDVEGLPCPNSVCPPDVVDATDQRNLLVGVGATGFSVGAAALVGMTIYLAWPGAETPKEGGLRFTPLVDPRAPGLLISGSF